MTMEKDLLKEVANISTGFAATALSTLLQRQVAMNVPEIALHAMEDLPRLSAYHQEVCATVHAPIAGDVEGTMFFLTSMDTAVRLVKMVLPNVESDLDVHTYPLASSAFQEIGNIVIGSYVTAIGSLTSLTLYPLVTELTIDIGSAVLAEATYQLVEVDQFFLMETSMKVKNEEEGMEGFLLFIPNERAVAVLKRALERDRT
ncbi:chemotaxis protein CheC [Bacillus sp. JCM 19047]|nr:chemotaxis protein CheC [Bacillus sp. JCM 19047]